MKRKALLGLLLLFLSIGGYSGEVTQSEAQIVALNWLNSHSDQFYYEKDISNINVLEENGSSLIYIVSFSPKGWVMVSGVDKTEPVLGYSASSVFDIQKMPAQLEGWIDGLEEELRKASSDDYIPSKEAEDRWHYFKSADLDMLQLKSLQSTSAGPLLTTTWDQGQYYNEMAPFDANSSAGNDHVWIGCVATAMAQVMKNWDYPVTGNGSHSYNHTDYGIQSADFGSTTYNWASMPNNLTAGNADVQKLSYHAAVAVNMNFGPSSSGAYLNDAVDAFTNYFSYNSPVLWVDKNEWESEAQWKELLRSEIDNGRPVIYSGFNSTLSSGHAFVCDGYSSGDYFHFNWGWGGYANGNFLLSSLTPAGRDYSSDQSAIFGIEPIKTASISFPYIYGFESGRGAFSLFGNSSVSVAESHTGSYGVQLSQEGFSSKSMNVANLTFVVPADGVLDFWVKRYTGIVASNNLQKVVLYPQYSSEPLIEIFNGNDYNDAGWVNYNTDISAYEGQTVRLMFVQQNLNPGAEQWMYIDDVAITGGSGNLPPYKPDSPEPADNSVSVDLSPVLKWTGGDPNGDEVDYWVYFGTDSNPPFKGTTFDTHMKVSNLEPKTKYYWKVKSNDDEARTVSDVWSFTTRGIPPEIESCGVVSVTSNSAVLCGKITDDNGSVISGRGIWYDNFPDPQKSDNERLSDDLSDVYEVEISGLDAYETYYAKPFAQSDEGYGVGSEFQFSTGPDVPEISFIKIEDIKRNSAVITGLVSDINDSILTKRGVLWSVNDSFNVETATIKSEAGDWGGTGEFDLLVDSLPGPDTIYFKVFAENSVGISYSEQYFFVTQNLIPAIDLDADNSSGRNGYNYEFSLLEQNEGGIIADSDIEISDADGDIIQKLVVTLDKQLFDKKEYLVYAGDEGHASVYGNLSDSLVVEYFDAESNLFWDCIINHIEYRNESNAPVADSVREINVVVNDGFDNSYGALCFITMVPQNDAPVSVEPTYLQETPKYNHYCSEIVEGVWSDSLDHKFDAEFEYTYSWEADFGDTVVIVEDNADSLFVDEALCGAHIRIVETVIDINSGGENEVSTQGYSEWYSVQKLEQEVVEFYLDESHKDIPTVEFSDKAYLFTGTATSGLPLYYGTFKNDFFEISNDSLFVKGIGMEPLYAYQPGNSCYFEADRKYKNINVVKGNQELVVYMDSVYQFDVDSIKLLVQATSGLNINVESSDSSILETDTHYAYVKGAGQCYLYFTQPGNEYFKAADTLSFSVEIKKAMPEILLSYQSPLQYGVDSVSFSVESNSGLNFSVSSVDSSKLKIEDDNFIVNGAGEAYVNVESPGNKNWALYDSTILVNINKGEQLINAPDSVEKHYNESPFKLFASTNSGLEVNYTVPENDVLLYENQQFKIIGTGEAKIMVEQSGNDNWNSVSDSVLCVVRKAEQIITTSIPDSITIRQKISYNDFEASSGLTAFVVESSDDDIIHIYEDSIVVNDKGNVTLEVSQAGSENYLPVTQKFGFHVAYPLNVEKFENVALDLFPNPADDRLHVVIDGNVQLPLDFSLLNVLGQVQLTDRITKQFQVIDVENIESGTYIVLLRNDDHYLTQKIIVK